MLRLLKDRQWRYKLEEFKKLAEAAGYTIVREVVQVKDKPRSATLFGRGKIEEMRRIVNEEGVEAVLVYNVLKSIQKVNLELALERRVLDRYDVTLEIFEKNATDIVSKLQIELARIRKEIPYARLMVNARFRGERVFRGAGGEYMWKARVAELRRRLKRLREEIEHRREEKRRQIEERKRQGYKIVSIVGYYNAGKTSLFNALTGENKPVSDMPFTTLSSKYSRLKLEGAEKILLVDTIGFVIDLDPRIIASFDINLDDMRYADMLLLVVDASDDLNWLAVKMDEILRILSEKVGLDNKRLLIALNKIDLLSSESEVTDRKQVVYERALMKLGREVPIIPISAKKEIGLDELVRRMVEEFFR